MYAKLKISADLTLLTGLHIGGSNEFSAIGTVDSPVVRDPLTGLPLIPGSSLKGKLRTLLVRSIKQAIALNEPAADPDEVLRLFGSSKPKANEKRPARSRLQFSDIFLTNRTQREQTGITEVKFESTISRATAVANPRQIERVVRGSVFGFVCIYDAEDQIGRAHV